MKALRYTSESAVYLQLSDDMSEAKEHLLGFDVHAIHCWCH